MWVMEVCELSSVVNSFKVDKYVEFSTDMEYALPTITYQRTNSMTKQPSMASAKIKTSTHHELKFIALTHDTSLAAFIDAMLAAYHNDPSPVLNVLVARKAAALAALAAKGGAV